MQSGNAQMKAASLVSMTHLSGYACRPLVSKTTSCVQPAAFRHPQISAISWTMWKWSSHFCRRFKCWVLRLLANACMSVSHKCWHARLPASPRAAWFPSGVLSSIYKFCDTNSSDLSVWSSVAPFCICTGVPNGLPVQAFANSKRSHCKRIPHDSKPLLAWFETMPSAPIFLYHLSTKTGVSLDGKSCTAGIDTTEPWHAMAMSVKSCIEVHWLHLVSGQGSSSASKTCPILAWACAWERVTASRWKMALRSEEKHRTLQS